MAMVPVRNVISGKPKCRYTTDQCGVASGLTHRFRNSRLWTKCVGFHARLPSGVAQSALNSWKAAAENRVSGGAAARGNSNHHPPPPLRGLRHFSATRASTVEGAGGWRWQEPLLDGSLSSADRAMLALVRAAANLSNKLAVEQAAAEHGLTLVTSSSVCMGPLLPLFGSTVDDDGEVGDGMALSPLSVEADFHERAASSLAGAAATALLSAVFPGAAAKSAAVISRTAPSAAVGMLVGNVANNTGGSSQNCEGRGADNSASSVPVAALCKGSQDVRLRNLALIVAEGGGGDEGEDEEVLQAFGCGGGGDVAARPTGIVGAAAAAWTLMTRSAVEMQVPTPVGHAAAGAASAAAHAAHAAVATAAKATAQMLPNYGEPSSSWLAADDTAGGVRYMVITAGGDLCRRTPRELTSDLVTFETYNLGIKVNRRLYSEATALYSRLMPLVMDFLEAVPDGNICFGGQGVGGSLAVLLQLMCCHRGLRFTRLLPAVAVDAPAVLAQVPREYRSMWGSDGPPAYPEDSLSQNPLDDVLEDIMQCSVLEELGLPQGAVRNLVLPPMGEAMALSQSASNVSALSSSSSSLLATLYGRESSKSQHQQQQQLDPSQHQSAALAPRLVMAAAAAPTGRGSAATASVTASPQEPQIFRQVGKLIHVETLGSVSGWVNSADVSAAAGKAQTAASASTDEAISETYSGRGDATVTAIAAMVSSSSVIKAVVKRLDVALIGSIATAAASAASAATMEQMRYMGSSTLQQAVKVVKGLPAAAPELTRVTAKRVAVAAVGAASVASTASSGSKEKGPVVWRASLEILRDGDVEDGEEDANVWGV